MFNSCDKTLNNCIMYNPFDPERYVVIGMIGATSEYIMNVSLGKPFPHQVHQSGYNNTENILDFYNSMEIISMHLSSDHIRHHVYTSNTIIQCFKCCSYFTVFFLFVLYFAQIPYFQVFIFYLYFTLHKFLSIQVLNIALQLWKTFCTTRTIDNILQCLTI